MKKIPILLLIFSIIFTVSLNAQEKIKIRINDSTFFEHDVIIIENDTIDGKKIAVYASDTTIVAYEKNYYNGFQTGWYKVYFPTGKLMETAIYMKGTKNGDYTLYSIDGSILIKGKYVNDVRDGYWAYRKDKLYGKFKDGKKHGKWKWYAVQGIFYVYKFDKDKLLSSSPKNNAPAFPEYIIKE